ncbi:MAG TPA: class II aldolase/adducin family protein, partial [Lentisphaeria bacterium]|nr:class II aldolase/adducin family protein [Lentisphaeria bacterium]
MIYAEEREQVAYFMRRLYRQGLTTTSGGNISCRVGDGCVAITASKLDKAELAASGVGVVELDGGGNLTPELGLSIETGMHLAIYRR